MTEAENKALVLMLKAYAIRIQRQCDDAKACAKTIHSSMRQMVELTGAEIAQAEAVKPVDESPDPLPAVKSLER